ncbi:MAG: cytochrome c-type biogenesis protein CcmH [Gammaproteobacteria bacterium]|nr:cytochrome c-type biogenesis protein CcmH [Gammaproteobacteria bacterium]MDH5693073.1 cytochrome c-type biogenesis protein CcmH [Gammaproteobacteria bacterium]
MFRFLVFLIVMMGTGSVSADTAVPNTPFNPEMEDRFKHLTMELRCLKCQNQTIYDSKAGLADDLKRQIRTQMEKGQSDQQIVDYLVARYGDFVLYKPKMSTSNMLLWVGPFLLLAIGGFVLIGNLRKRQKIISDAPLTEEESRRVQTLINSESGENHK